MQITLSFDSFEEFCAEIGKYAARIKPKKPELVPVEEVAEVLKEQEATEKAKPAPKKAEKPVPAPAADPDPAPAATPAVDESYRVALRKKLHDLNTAKGKNVAITLINALGYKSIGDMPLEVLPELDKKVEEAANA